MIVNRLVSLKTSPPMETKDLCVNIGLTARPPVEGGLGLVRYNVSNVLFGGTSGNVQRNPGFKHSLSWCQPDNIRRIIWDLEQCFLKYAKKPLDEVVNYDDFCEKDKKRSLIEQCLTAPEEVCVTDDNVESLIQS